MIKIVSVEQMREIEAEADASGVSYDSMMQRAGEAVALRALDFIRTLPEGEPPRVTVLVGAGNNGGDGLVAGREIAKRSNAVVRFYLLKRRPYEDLIFKSVQDAGLFIAHAEDDQRYRVLTHSVASADVLIDALFGIGVKLPLRDDAAKVLREVKAALSEDQPPTPPFTFPGDITPIPKRPRRIIAVDCPSGLDCNSGEIDANAIPADETVTFIAAKPGLLAFPGANAVGNLIVAYVGVPSTMSKLKAVADTLIDSNTVRDLLPKRPQNANKGTFGKVLVIGGSANYVGASALSAHAAYVMGAGLVSAAVPAAVAQRLGGTLPEVTWLPCPEEDGIFAAKAMESLRETAETYSAIVLGPGIGRGKSASEFVDSVLYLASDKNLPIIIDADALNALAESDKWWQHMPEQTVITPHPGEMGRLTGLKTDEVQAARIALARNKAKEWGVTVLLKGAHTVVASPDGQVGVLPFKTSALSTAGTGDVLSGLVGTLLAQRLSPHDAAVAASYIHGLAGDYAAKSVGSTRAVMASDVIASVRDVLRDLEVK